jgi:hypothetical protein
MSISSFRHRKLLAALAATLAVVFSTVVVAGPAEAKTGCVKTKKSGDTQYYKCVTSIKTSSRKFTIGYKDSVRNGTGSSIEGNCTSSQSKTVTRSISSSVEAEAGFIFGKASVKVEGSFQKSVSSGYSTSATFKVPARTTRYCDRGVVSYKVTGHFLRMYCSIKHGTCHVYGDKNFSGRAPTRAQWDIH